MYVSLLNFFLKQTVCMANSKIMKVIISPNLLTHKHVIWDGVRANIISRLVQCSNKNVQQRRGKMYWHASDIT